MLSTECYNALARKARSVGLGRASARRNETSAELINGKKIAAEIRSELAEEVRRLSESGTPPGLAAVLVGDDPASALYIGNKERAAADVGVVTETFRLPASASESDVLHLVGQINGDGRFHGIIVQLPLPPQVNADRVALAILPEKDVDGAHPVSMGKLARGEETFVPPTPLGIQKLLIRSGIEVEGRHVVVCGRSNLVGRPVALLLQQKGVGANATVTVCHTGTIDLARYTREADILITAMGQPGLISGDMVKPGAVVIDVATNQVPDASKRQGFRFVGDVDFEGAKEVTSAITPVPGGVGPMTVAMLLSNTVTAAKNARRAVESSVG